MFGDGRPVASGWRLGPQSFVASGCIDERHTDECQCSNKRMKKLSSNLTKSGAWLKVAEAWKVKEVRAE